MSAEEEVRKASQQFYAGLTRMSNGEAGAMAEVWSHTPTATAMHPVGGCTVGWEAVKESFDKVAQLAAEGEIALRDQRIQVGGDLAYEVGVERGQFKFAGEPVTIEHRVTNIYRREAGGWKMTHHHTDISPAMLEVLRRL